MITTEKQFESDIEYSLITHGGYEQFSWQDGNGKWVYKYHYDVKRAIYLDVLVEFIKKTQPKAWAKYTHYYGDSAPEQLYARFEKTVSENGLLHTLRNGIEDLGVKLKVCYFKPESSLNEDLVKCYEGNILGCTRQFAYSDKNHNTIDMVLSINGIPVVALELKNQFTGQNYENGIKQYKMNRDSKEFCFRPNHRFLVYFALDHYEAWMTTQLKDGATYFMPFNQGSNGAGVDGGKGNPANPDGYPTSYLWERVLERESLLDLCHRFISYVEEKDEVIRNGVAREVKKAKIIFPRFHQYDVVKKLIADVKENGVGRSYLIEHSAGSGKSNSIAWTAYRLASLHNDENDPVFDSVIVVTNRVVLDSQLQDTINSFEHTYGLVEAIDDKKRSRGLTAAINDRKRIIICTIQKFLVAYKDFDSMQGRKFAIIVDEAHQGQSGESAKTLRRALIDMGLAVSDYAKEEGIEEDEVDIENEAVYKLVSQGKHSNQSFFAFTATPKPKTIELFGTPSKTLFDEEGKPKMEPFHVYSMRQAIEEGFILDVLANYTTIKEAFRIAKISEDDPELLEGPALRALVKYYKQHGHTIREKTDMIMANFLENCRFQIGGKGKAMIVADSRANAVRYYFAVKQYLKDNAEKAKGSDVLVAFSGTVKLDGKEYTEAGLNFDQEGHSINTDKKFRKAFRSEDFNIMVVANKYQTGFDEPLLHTMYVDKKLKGVNAVQTLSRLNRTCQGKESTFVLDFENTDEDIKNSFQPFYGTTLLKGRTDFNRVYDLRNKIKPYMLYNTEDVEKFYSLMSSQAGKKQDPTAFGRLSSILKPIEDRYVDLEQKERDEVRDLIRRFNNAYAYITQLTRLHDEGLFKEYLFTTHLISVLPTEGAPTVDIDDKIKLQYTDLKETFSGAIVLEKKSTDLIPSQGNAKKNVPKKDTLQRIIDKVNERFGGEFAGADINIVQNIFQRFMADSDIKKFKRYAKDNNPEMFVKSLFPDKFKSIATKCYSEDFDAYQKLFSDPEFYQKVMQAMAEELYKVLRKD